MCCLWKKRQGYLENVHTILLLYISAGIGGYEDGGIVLNEGRDLKHLANNLGWIPNPVIFLMQRHISTKLEVHCCYESLRKLLEWWESISADPRQQQGAKSESQALCHLEATRRGRFVVPHRDYQKLSTEREGTK